MSIASDSKQPDTRTRILTAASQMLRRSSPSALTYRALGKKAGLPHSTIEYHFPTREDLLMEAASQNVEVWVDRARKIRDNALRLSPQELRDQLPEILVAAVLPQTKDVQYIRTYLLHGLVLAEHQVIVKKNREGRARFDEYVADILQAAECSCLPDVIISVIDGLAYEAVSEGGEFPQDVVEKLRSFVLSCPTMAADVQASASPQA